MEFSLEGSPSSQCPLSGPEESLPPLSHPVPGGIRAPCPPLD